MPSPQKQTSNRQQEARPVQVIVETPGRCRNKHKIDEETDRMKLSRVMPQGMVFPYDFGFFPETSSDDGDPLDVLRPNNSRCALQARWRTRVPAAALLNATVTASP